MEPSTIFTASVGFYWIVFLWDLYLAFRQYCTYVNTTERPQEVFEIMNKEDFEKSRSYKIEKAQFSLIHSVYNQIEGTLILWFELMAVFWFLSGDLSASVGMQNEYVHSIVFMSLLSVVQSLMGLPWSLYDTFVIEQRHGFNKQTLGFFLKDHVKKMILSLSISAPIIAAIIWIVRAGGDLFFLYIWIFLSVFTLVMMTIYPEFIAPLFDKYSPLPEGVLRTKIEALAARLSYPLTKLLVVENSKRSAHSNAYLYGFWNNKRIVLYDTLLEDYSPVDRTEADPTAEETVEKDSDEEPTLKEDKPATSERKKLGMSNDEVVAVLGHELGHWKLNHVLKSLFISELNLMLMIYGFACLFDWTELYTAFGFHNTQPTLVGLVLVFTYVFAPYNEILNFLMTLFTRHNEFEADEFSAKLGYGDLLVSALIKLSKDNLTFPVNDWLYSSVNHSHPPVVERARAIREVQHKLE